MTEGSGAVGDGEGTEVVLAQVICDLSVPHEQREICAKAAITRSSNTKAGHAQIMPHFKIQTEPESWKVSRSCALRQSYQISSCM